MSSTLYPNMLGLPLRRTLFLAKNKGFLQGYFGKRARMRPPPEGKEKQLTAIINLKQNKFLVLSFGYLRIIDCGNSLSSLR